MSFIFQDIETGVAKISLAGGTDNMSQAPFAVRNVRFGTNLGVNLQLEDTLWVGLTDTYCKLPMALTAEKLGEEKGIKREDVDKFSLQSQQKWKQGNFSNNIQKKLQQYIKEKKTKKMNNSSRWWTFQTRNRTSYNHGKKEGSQCRNGRTPKTTNNN